MAERRAAGVRRPALLALMITVLYGALVTAVDGFIALLGDQDPVPYADAGPLVGPGMGLVACAIVFWAALRGLRRPARAIVRALLAALAVYVLGPLAGALLYLLGSADAFRPVLFLAHFLLSPFTIAAALIALLAVALVPALAASSALREL